MGRATEQTSFKTIAQSVGYNTADGVVIHGFWKMKRRRGLSMSFAGEKNPTKAFIIALHKSNIDELSAVRIRELFDRNYCHYQGIED